MFFGQPFGGVIAGAGGAVLSVLLRTDAPLTGRQIHGLVSDRHSLWSVQEALKSMAELGLIETQTIGRAGVHTINERHVAIAPLRTLIDPIALLTAAIDEAIDSHVKAVVIFGSIARGEGTDQSDIDLAIIADPTWGGRDDLQDTIRTRLGNESDVVVFTDAEFQRLARAGEPVVHEIVRDGVALIGAKPRVKRGAA